MRNSTPPPPANPPITLPTPPPVPLLLGQPDAIVYGNERVERLIIRGVQPEYAAALPLFSVSTGRFISQYDDEHARDVAVIGAAIADSLFPHSDPIGKAVRLNGKLFEVIGVFDRDPGLFGGFQLDKVKTSSKHIPFSWSGPDQ